MADTSTSTLDPETTKFSDFSFPNSFENGDRPQLESYPKPSTFARQIAQRQYFFDGEDWSDMIRRVADHVALAEAIDAYKKIEGHYPDWYQTFESRREWLQDPDKIVEWAADENVLHYAERWGQIFYHLIRSRKFTPAGRILRGANSTFGQMQNCFTISSDGTHIEQAEDDPDSIKGIYELAYKIAEITKRGGGVGIALSHLRESGARVHGSSGHSSGPVSFLRQVYAPTLRVIEQGNRRGAGMAGLKIDHPDALDFMTAKDLDREEVEGPIESFNISFLVTDDFMEAVKADKFWFFKSVTSDEIVPPTEVAGKYHYPGHDPTSVTGNPDDPPTSKEIPLRFMKTKEGDGAEVVEDYEAYKDMDGLFAVRARWLWDEIAEHAHQTGDPGVLFYDRANEYWPLRQVLGDQRVCNPCGESWLYDKGESCDLGSLVLPSFVEDGELQEDDLRYAVNVAVRFLDNVLTMNAHPLPECQDICDDLRRVGLGVMGDADLCAKMGLPYDSDEAMELRNEVGDVIRSAGITASRELANDKDPFPLCEASALNHSRRNVQIFAIAPTGTVSMASDVASGIEPIYALVMQRKVGNGYRMRLHPSFEKYLQNERADIDLDDQSQYVTHSLPAGIGEDGTPFYRDVEVHKLVRDVFRNNGSIKGLDQWFTEEEQAQWRVAHDVDPADHIRVQSVWQNGLDGNDGAMPMNSTSKTINLPEDASVQEVQNAYMSGWKSNLKGITIYRDGSRQDQVLRTDSDEDEGEETAKPSEIERPETLHGATSAIDTPLGKLYLTVNEHDGQPYEVFFAIGKAGGSVHANAEAIARVISTALQHGVPMREIHKQLRGISSERAMGFGPNKVHSMPDGAAQLMERWMDGEVNGNGKEDVLNPCPDCGVEMTRQEGCLTCLSCGKSKCS